MIFESQRDGLSIRARQKTEEGKQRHKLSQFPLTANNDPRCPFHFVLARKANIEPDTAVRLSVLAANRLDEPAQKSDRGIEQMFLATSMVRRHGEVSAWTELFLTLV